MRQWIRSKVQVRQPTDASLNEVARSQQMSVEVNEDSSANNSHNRTARWKLQELNSLKTAMTIFGDQSWRKIQRFLVQEQKTQTQSKQISKSQGAKQFTFRSIKAIQNKIYQIKTEVEQENSLIQTQIVDQ